MRKKLFFRLASLSIAFSLLGCSDLINEDLNKHEDSSVEEMDAVTRAVLDGFTFDATVATWVKKIEDPYTLKNFQEAYDNLAVTTRSLSTNLQLQPTHYNVRFNPKNPDEIELLREMYDGELCYTPMDAIPMDEDRANRIAKATHIQSPDLDGRYIYTQEPYYLEEYDIWIRPEPVIMPYIWVVWPVNQEIPQDIDHEILYEVFLPEESDQLAMSAELITELEEHAISQSSARDNPTTGGGDGGSPPRGGGGDSEPFTNSGRLEVYDASKNGYYYLSNVKVVLRDGSKSASCYTSTRGTFYMDGTWSRNTRLEVHAEGTKHYITTRGGAVAVYNAGLMIDQDYPTKFPSNLVLSIQRAAEFWVNGSHRLNKDILDRRIRIIADAGTSPDGYLGVYENGSRNITVWYNTCRTDVQVLSTTLHEIGHAVHQRHSTSSMTSIDRSIKEGWASFAGWYMTNLYYSSHAGPNPYHTDRQEWKMVNTSSTAAYNPFFVDLYDDYNQREEQGSDYPRDYISYVPADVIQDIAFRSRDFGQLQTQARKWAPQYYSLTHINWLLEDCHRTWFR